ncbi:hypothetical protein D3C71_1898410 [compost metagenome]
MPGLQNGPFLACFLRPGLQLPKNLPGNASAPFFVQNVHSFDLHGLIFCLLPEAPAANRLSVFIGHHGLGTQLDLIKRLKKIPRLRIPALQILIQQPDQGLKIHIL